MNNRSILPGEPSHPVQPPMIFVKKKIIWEYHEIIRDIESGSLLTVEELNKLGTDGWELTGTVEQRPLVHYYFKRQTEK